MTEIKKVYLNNKVTEKYFKEHLDANTSFSNKIINNINFQHGTFFTFLPSDAAFEQLYDFEIGWILPPFGKNIQGNYEIIPTMNQEISEYIIDYVKFEDRLALFEHYNATPTDPHIVIEGIGITFFGNEVYYFANHKTSDKTIKKALQKTKMIWHSLTLLAHGIESLPPQLTEEDLNNVCAHLTHVITTAYDGEGYIIWEKSEYESNIDYNFESEQLPMLAEPPVEFIYEAPPRKDVNDKQS